MNARRRPGSRGLGLITLLALGLLAAACGSPEVASTQGDDVEGGCPAPEDIQGELIFGGVGGTAETIFLETLIPAFEEEFPNVTVQHVTATPSQHYQLLEADPEGAGFDVVWSDLFTHELGKEEGLFAANECIPNEDELYDRYLDPDGIGIRTNLAATGLVYNPEALAEAGIEPPDSWTDLWDPAFEGRVGVWSIPGSVGMMTLFAILETEGGSIAEPDIGFERLRALVESGAVVFEAPTELEELLASGEVWIAPSSDARAFQAVEKGIPAAFVRPEEGLAPMYNYFDIPISAPNIDAARAWTNFVIREDNLIHLVEGIFVSPVNENIELTDELSGMLVDSSDEVESLLEPDLAALSAAVPDWTQRFNREVVGG